MRTTLSKLRERRAQGDKGFTLIELLVVVVILGILIAIAIPLYLNYRKGANDAAAKSDLRGAINIAEQCNTDNGTYPVTTGFTAAAPCANQVISLSAGSTISTYIGNPTTATGTAASPYTSYIMVTTSSTGASKWYCYNSATGGSVKTYAVSTTTC